MDIEEKMELILKEPTEEVVTKEELKQLLETNAHPRAYDGFEPSGILGIHSALMRAIKVQDMLDAGCQFTILIADWHGWLNKKLGGNLEAIKKAGKYFVHGWASFGIDTKKVEIRWASEAVKDPEYWKLVMNVAQNATISRMLRCSPIMGRKEGEMQELSSLIYPAMQVADIFYMDIDICQLGMDQRRANMLAREVADKLGKRKPVAVHHHMLRGLVSKHAMGSEFDEDKKINEQIASKMSKSKPETSIYIHDSPEEVRRKIRKAYCPEKVVEGNPVLEICRYIIFRKVKEFVVERPEKFGGNVSFWSYKELEDAYREGKLHPLDLKEAVARELNKLLEPSREYFERNKEARELRDFMLKQLITR